MLTTKDLHKSNQQWLDMYKGSNPNPWRGQCWDDIKMSKVWKIDNM